MPHNSHNSRSSDKEQLLAQLDFLSQASKHKRDFVDAFKVQFAQSLNDYTAKDRLGKTLLADVRNRNDIFYHWSRIAENLYNEIDVRTTILAQELKKEDLKLASTSGEYWML